MKNFAAALVAALLLSACPMTTPETTPVPQSSSGTCLQPVELSAAPPSLQPWTGQLPTPPSPNVVWVLSPRDEKETQWVLSLVETEKNYIAFAYAVDGKDVAGAIARVTAQEIAVPRIALAVLGGLRPLPQPGPPGEPGKREYTRHLNAGRGFVWAERVASQLEKGPQQ